jgi:putative ABC transport system substrate-binding protein
MTVSLGRRQFIATLGAAAAVRPLTARAQQAKLRTIGYFGGSLPALESQRTTAFVQRLRELGWIEGRSVSLEYRWGEERAERYGELAAELVRLNVDVLVVTGTAPALAAKRVTSTVPIVFGFAGDPVGTGLVVSLTRPASNVTGLSNQASDLVAPVIDHDGSF